jgi:DNA-binding protein H-NS
MATTYSQLMKQIDVLRAQADNLKRKEAGDVIARIKEAIAAYDLSPADLFNGAAGKRRSPGKAAKRTRAAATGGAARYSDGAGNVWGGRGPRPHWLRDALAAGKKLSEFETKSQAPVAASGASSTRKAKAKKAKRSGAVKFRDEAGNTWTGVGRKPKWFEEALAAGKSPEELAA